MLVGLGVGMLPVGMGVGNPPVGMGVGRGVGAFVGLDVGNPPVGLGDDVGALVCVVGTCDGRLVGRGTEAETDRASVPSEDMPKSKKA